MKKRGQIAVFVVVGIVVLAVILLLFVFRDKVVKLAREEPTNTQDYLNQQLLDIKKDIGRCTNQETEKASELLMKNGGNLDSFSGYISYTGVQYPILCREINQTGTCLAEPILLFNLEKKLDNYLPDKIKKCINFDAFRNKDYDLSVSDMELNTHILGDVILVHINMPVKLTKGSYSSNENQFLYNLNIPLGSLSIVVNDLVQVKAGGAEINTILYSLLHFNKYTIDVRKPYPDEIYTVRLTEDDKYIFYFGIEGVGRFARPEGRIR